MLTDEEFLNKKKIYFLFKNKTNKHKKDFFYEQNQKNLEYNLNSILNEILKNCEEKND